MKKLPTPVLATSIPIDWVKVKSSTIQAVSYNKEAKAMHVMFLGGELVFHAVCRAR